MVLQIGIPQMEEQYVHRVGRTARAGADGRGVIILDQCEASFLNGKTIRQIAISKEIATIDPETASQIASAAAAVTPDLRYKAYRAWLGYYKANQKIFPGGVQGLVKAGNQMVWSWGWPTDSTPKISSMLAGKMGLKSTFVLYSFFILNLFNLF